MKVINNPLFARFVEYKTTGTILRKLTKAKNDKIRRVKGFGFIER